MVERMWKCSVALFVCLTPGSLSAAPADIPEYTKQRYDELRQVVWETERDVYCALLAVASDDPATVAEGEKMILRRIEIERAHIAFMKLDIVLAYRLFKDKLSPEARQTIAQFIRESIEPGSVEYGRRFVHANDNWPFAACYMMIIGGEAIGRDDLAQEGILRLETYLDLCRQLGVGSEYNSPTYNPLSLACVEAIATFSESLRARVVARVIAERLWTEIALRYHAPSSQFAAPHSRAYMHDTLGVGSSLRYVMHPLLPNGVLLDRESFPEIEPRLTVVSENTLIRHFFDPHLVAICERKTFPYVVQARKYRPFKLVELDTWPGGFFDTITYMTERYAVGSAQRPYGDGSGNTAFQVHWTKVPQTTKPGDTHTLYPRYRVNDALPVPTESVFPESGYIHPLQHRNTTIILYRPKLALNGAVKALCASALVAMPTQLDAVYVGFPPKKVTGWPMSLKKPASVFIQDADVYLAIHPLTITDRGRREAMRLEHAAKHLIVSYYNLQADAEATWDEATFLETRSGFVVEVGDAREFGSFNDFARTVGTPRLADTLRDGVRTVSYSRMGRSMVVSQRVATQEYLARTYDGEEYSGPLLRSPHTVASLDAAVKLADATLTSRPGEPKWLTVEPTTGSYVVLYPFRYPFPLHLATPKGELHCDGFRMGRIVYQPGADTRVVIDCARAPRPLRFTEPEGAYTVILNDVDVTEQARSVEGGYLEIAMPGNDRPDAMHARLELDIRPTFEPLRRGEKASLSATVRSVGEHAARAVIATPYYLGFARNYGSGDRYAPRLGPGASVDFRWAITGSNLGAYSGVRIVATAENAPPTVAEVQSVPIP